MIYITRSDLSQFNTRKKKKKFEQYPGIISLRKPIKLRLLISTVYSLLQFIFFKFFVIVISVQPLQYIHTYSGSLVKFHTRCTFQRVRQTFKVYVCAKLAREISQPLPSRRGFHRHISYPVDSTSTHTHTHTNAPTSKSFIIFFSYVHINNMNLIKQKKKDDKFNVIQKFRVYVYNFKRNFQYRKLFFSIFFFFFLEKRFNHSNFWITLSSSCIPFLP